MVRSRFHSLWNINTQVQGQSAACGNCSVNRAQGIINIKGCFSGDKGAAAFVATISKSDLGEDGLGISTLRITNDPVKPGLYIKKVWDTEDTNAWLPVVLEIHRSTSEKELGPTVVEITLDGKKDDPVANSNIQEISGWETLIEDMPLYVDPGQKLTEPR